MGHVYTGEQIEFMKQHIVNMTWNEVTIRFNETFNVNLSCDAIKGKALRENIQSGRTGYFPKGNAPANKGKKYPGKTNSGSFKKGQKPSNYKPIGYERVDRDGYTLVKVSDTGPWHHRWRHKHKVMWEKEHGAIPPGHVVLFADGNKENIVLENFILVTNAQLARLNQNHLISKDPELTKTGIIIADVLTKIGERKKAQ